MAQGIFTNAFFLTYLIGACANAPLLGGSSSADLLAPEPAAPKVCHRFVGYLVST